MPGGGTSKNATSYKKKKTYQNLAKLLNMSETIQ